ncbi:Retrovirus-related Pol polyprotein from transposon TNT 1-94 [Vitis vinifera]|uniref:Retrovirus-related Pol polyprotein from transposon TNT 1-94 n=1 Tax=Vitis vinifera TaxID=29760 RepID=A0A438GJ30_VITVI|nr:Retrovirus-related Pol polyprotein from transposon TNT 1-94 [Vitis vinifera]
MSLMIMKHSILEAIRGVIPEETRAKTFLDQIANRFAETKRFKALKLELSEDILVHLVLISLSTQFSPFKISYNTQKEKWTLNELIAQCVQEKERLKQEKIESAHLASTSQGFEINLAIVSTDTWWIDTGATTHISVTMQGCLWSRMPTDGERYIYVGNGNKATVKAIDICGPFPTPSWNGQQYFITFIDDYSRYDYLYLIHEKSQSLEVFKNFKAEVENQLSKKIKAVSSDCGGEYYGRYDGSGEQRPEPFAKYLMECGIVPHTMSGTPSQNGVAERRNRTLKDMTKRDSKGNIVRYKARLVAKGFTQKGGIDYKETFSPVSSKDSFRIIMALIAHYDLELHQMDVKIAFLNGNIDETIYMVQPEDFESNDSKDRSKCILELSQKAYIDKVLSRFGVSNCAPGDMPVAKGDKFSLHQCPKNELEKKDMERFPYASTIGSLMYAQVYMLSDIVYIVGISNHLEIVGYLDSDFVGCLNSRRSTSGYIFMLVGGAVSWKSVKQTLIAFSTMEAEFIACYEASNHGIWL